jgi:hypothetical protein
MKGATFMAEVDRAASELATATRRALAAAVVRSVDYVHEVVGDENAPPPLRARIALGLVGLTARSLVETPGVAAEQQGAASALLEQIADAAMPAEVRAWIRANPARASATCEKTRPGGFLELSNVSRLCIRAFVSTTTATRMRRPGGTRRRRPGGHGWRSSRPSGHPRRRRRLRMVAASARHRGRGGSRVALRRGVRGGSTTSRPSSMAAAHFEAAGPSGSLDDLE